MAESQSPLQELDDLKSRLDAALAEQDWDALVELNQRIKPTVEPVMAALKHQEVDPEEVRVRLEALNRFIETVDQEAVQARDEARQSLKGVNQNRNAARAYQGVSSGRPK